jgi:hypothetical protein
MTDDERDQKTFDLLMSLLDHPSRSWEKREVDSMRIDVECGEYENPFGNIIAMGLHSAEGFDATQIETLNTLIELMDLEGHEWVLKLREWQATHLPSRTTNK